MEKQSNFWYVTLAVRGPEGVGERVECATSLPKLVELGVHPIEGVVLVVGAALELLAPTNQNL
jgi:hypothetical protein